MISFDLSDHFVQSKNSLAGIAWNGRANDSSLLQAQFGYASCNIEQFSTSGSINKGSKQNLHWACNDEWALVSVSVPESECPNIEEAAYLAYKTWNDALRTLGQYTAFRFWNFLPRINEGEGDAERYRLFCNGRAAAFLEDNTNNCELPAASAIGNNGDQLLVYGLACRQGFQQIENPRQVSAYQYPRQYGPTSPSFARAALVSSSDSKTGQLFVSGTASVLGHQSMHVDSCQKQTEESIRNIEALITEAAANRGQPFTPTLLRAYVRDADNLELVEATVKQRWPHSPLQLLVGDICRADLLVELEGVFQAS